jgi:hypothetical protein
MIVRRSPRERDRTRWLARRQWRTVYVLVAWLHVEGFGKVWVLNERLETRWSDTANRRLWRVLR